MEAEIQTRHLNTPEDKIKALKRDNRRLMKELLEAKESLEKCKKEGETLVKYVALFEDLVRDLLYLHYQSNLKVSFTNLEICTGERCITFRDYEELLIGLRAAILLLK